MWGCVTNAEKHKFKKFMTKLLFVDLRHAVFTWNISWASFQSPFGSHSTSWPATVAANNYCFYSFVRHISLAFQIDVLILDLPFFVAPASASPYKHPSSSQ